MTRCISSQWFDDKTNRYYANIKDKVWVTTAKELFKTCIQCPSFLWCDKKKDLVLLLMLNELWQAE